VYFLLMMRIPFSSLLASAALIAVTAPLFPQSPVKPKPEDTEIWEPVPKVVTPGVSCMAAPSDAIVLFDGKNLDEWVTNRDKSPAKWDVADGVMTVNKSGGSIETKRSFTNYQLHLEWKVPANITGSIYKQAIPLANPGRKPGDWQAYDVVWTAPRFNPDGSVKTPAYVTAFFNGVLVENHFELTGQTLYIGKPFYKPYTSAPIKLQAHGDKSEPISFRNIWIRELN
jgi:hypothetical protein